MNVVFLMVVIVGVVAYLSSRKEGKTKPPVKSHRVVYAPPRPSLPTAANAEQVAAGKYGENEVAKVLKSMAGHIDGYISTDNMYYAGEHFQCDFLVKLKGRGLLLIEVKNFAGMTLCSGDEEWSQYKPGEARALRKNACLQVERTRGLVSGLLAEQALLYGSISKLVVFSHRTSRVLKEVSANKPQCDIAHINDLPAYIKRLASPNDGNDIERKRFDRICAVLKQHERPYRAA